MAFQDYQSNSRGIFALKGGRSLFYADNIVRGRRVTGPPRPLPRAPASNLDKNGQPTGSQVYRTDPPRPSPKYPAFPHSIIIQGTEESDGQLPRDFDPGSGAWGWGHGIDGLSPYQTQRRVAAPLVTGKLSPADAGGDQLKLAGFTPLELLVIAGLSLTVLHGFLVRRKHGR